MRRLSKLAFVHTSVADCFHALPVRATCEGDDGHGAAKSLREVAREEGSLCKLYSLGGLDQPFALSDEKDANEWVNTSGQKRHSSYMSHIK